MEVSIAERKATRLKDKAKAAGMDFLKWGQKYAQTRILMRLAAHPEASSMILTGGCLYHIDPDVSDLKRTTAASMFISSTSRRTRS